ncbi:helix-turn-helix transcriptional regulator [Gemmobacter nectariphilus]|uniref:helix-turn-helix transcriptional regulator n=1 Tax=Gemmobacter nectariphilus TaxID=220343 RepID=UPI00041DE96B|nr:AlpA family phage regulatory protein [Gemmobacter nectariphilus]
MARKIARLPRVEELTGLKKTKIYDMMNAREFPRPIRLTGKAVGWFEDDIEAWLASRPVAV